MTQPVSFPSSTVPVPPTTSAQPTAAFIGASWGALLLGITAYLVGLYNATGMELNEKGYYFTVLCYGLFSAVSLQKAVRDRMEDVPVTNLYFGLCWISVGVVLTLLTAGLWNATQLALSEKGFYGMAFTLSMFAAVAVQKNVRDMNHEPEAAEAPARVTPAPVTQAPVRDPRIGY